MRHLAIIAATIAATAAGSSGCWNPLAASDDITYTVTGTAAMVSVAYTGPNNSLGMSGEVGVPWSKTVPIKKGSTIQLEAKIVSESGCLVVEIATKGGSPRRSPEICGTKGQVASVSTNN
jgi:hypothetical protein